MRFQKTIIYIILIFCVTVSGCKKSAVCDCFKGTGDEVTEERAATPFHYIELRNKADLFIHPSSEYRIQVKAGEKLIEKITTKNENGVLKIDNENKCNWVRDFKNKFEVHVYAPMIDTIEVYDSPGNVTFTDTLFVHHFQFESWGSSGDYHILIHADRGLFALQTGPSTLNVEGFCDVSFLWNQGQGTYDAKNLETSQIYATNRGSNHMYFNSKKRIFAKIEFSGNIYYGGNADELELEDYGSGEFIKSE